MNKQLFSLNLQHEYYDDRKFWNVEVRPDYEAARAIGRFGLLAIQRQNIFQLLHPARLELSELINYMIKQGVESLRFNLISDSTELYQISDFPTDSIGQLRFNSSHTKASGKGVSASEAIVLEVRYSSDSPLVAGSIGTLEIDLEDLLEPPIVNAGQQYAINISARTTQWQYYLFNRSQRQLSNPSVVDGSGWSFEGPIPITVNDEHGLLFSSGEKSFPLRQSAYRTFMLRNQSAKNGSLDLVSKTKILIKELPIPSPQETYFESRGEQNLGYSQMYVYL